MKRGPDTDEESAAEGGNAFQKVNYFKNSIELVTSNFWNINDGSKYGSYETKTSFIGSV